MQKSGKMRMRWQWMLLAAGMMLQLSGCGTVHLKADDVLLDTKAKLAEAEETVAQPPPVVSITAAAWLMGDAVEIAAPVPAVLTKQIAFNRSSVTLIDVASYISQKTNLVVDTSEVQSLSAGPDQGGASSGATPTASGSLMLPTPSQLLNNSSSRSPQLPVISISYDGQVSGLIDLAANKSGVSWKFSEGRISFFRTITKTIYIPAIARKSAGNSTISANSANAGSSTSGGSTVATNIGANSSTGGATSTSDYSVDVWSSLEKTAKTVAGTGTGAPAQVVGDPNLGSITVTGTPVQVKNVEEWAKGLADNLSQQILITAAIYSLKVDDDDNYQWNPSVIYKKISSAYSFGLTGPQAPALPSGETPFSLTAGVLNGSGSNFSGSELAFKAISTLGRASEQIRQSVVTLNGQPAPMQIAQQIGYLQSTGTNLTANVGSSTTLTPGTVTTGFTAMFLPRIVNGKILLSMTMTNSSLISIDTVTSGVGASQASIQTPNVSSSTFQQSVSLTPGDALLLTGLQTNNGQINKSGVGSPNNALLGGGQGASTGKQIISIVITARVL